MIFTAVIKTPNLVPFPPGDMPTTNQNDRQDTLLAKPSS